MSTLMELWRYLNQTSDVIAAAHSNGTCTGTGRRLSSHVVVFCSSSLDICAWVRTFRFFEQKIRFRNTPPGPQ